MSNDDSHPQTHHHHHHSNVQLTQEANELIADYYTELRATSGDRALPVTVRSLETIVRLASAHAKVRRDVSVVLHVCFICVKRRLS